VIDAKGDIQDCQLQPVSRKMAALAVISLQPSGKANCDAVNTGIFLVAEG
jgi:hypothetical protein